MSKNMSDFKQQQLEKARVRALSEMLVQECKSENGSVETVKAAIDSGADIHFKHSEPLRWATKRKNFAVIKFLINQGALESDTAKRYIAQICDVKFKEEKHEKEFFEVLDLAHSKTGDYMSLFVPYINQLVVHGKTEKLKALKTRYYLTESEVVEQIEMRIIFEIVKSGKEEMLTYIEKHKEWVGQESFDLAVSTGECGVLQYMLDTHGYLRPSDKAVAIALFDGKFELLDMLIEEGYDFENNPLFLERACRAAFANGTAGLKYLLKYGYSLEDSYKGKSVLENARDDKNIPLLEFILGIND